MRYKISSLRQIVLFLSAWNNCNDKKSLGMFILSFFINPRKEISIVCCFLLEPLNEIIWLCKIWFVWHRKNNYVYLWIMNGKYIMYSMKSWNVALSQQISWEIFRFYNPAHMVLVHQPSQDAPQHAPDVFSAWLVIWGKKESQWGKKKPLR